MVKARNGHVSEEEEVEEVSENEVDGSEEEYEIETILDAKQGAFEGGKLGYLVKWKGYTEEQNSWVSEEDASNAQGLIQAYWDRVHKKNEKKKPAAPRKSDAKPSAATASKKRASPDDAVESVSAPPKKRGRPPKEKPVSESEDEEPQVPKATPAKKGRKSTGQQAKRARDSDAMDEDVTEEPYASMKRWADVPSWEHLVDHIDTVEKTEDGKLYVYFQLTKKYGDKMCREETSICRKKMPNLLFDFYEHNLRWRPFDG